MATLQGARDAFAAADPNSGAFAGGGMVLVTGTGAADTVDQPFSELGKHKKLRHRAHEPVRHPEGHTVVAQVPSQPMEVR